MGAYATYSNKSFKSNGKINMKRKRGTLDRNMELVKNAHIVFKHDTQTIEVIKNDRSDQKNGK
jgi:hypothetical protein